MSRANTWTNSDGLVVGFGTHTVDNNVAAFYPGSNGETTIVQEITLADLPDTFAAANRDPQEVVIPRGSVVKNAYVQVITAPTSAATNATLDIGTWGTADVVDDADGLVADATIAELGVAGQVIQLDGVLIADAASAQAGAGATSNSDVVLAASYETEAFTAGLIKLVVTIIPPTGSTDGTIAN